MADPVLVAADAMAKSGVEVCACGRRATVIHGSVNRKHRWSSATVYCGDQDCLAYSIFGGPGGTFSVAPVPDEFVRQGRGVKAMAIRQARGKWRKAVTKLTTDGVEVQRMTTLLVLKSMGFKPDWVKQGTPEYLARFSGCEFAFRGPGWYLGNTRTIYVWATDIEGVFGLAYFGYQHLHKHAKIGWCWMRGQTVLSSLPQEDFIVVQDCR